MCWRRAAARRARTSHAAWRARGASARESGAPAVRLSAARLRNRAGGTRPTSRAGAPRTRAHGAWLAVLVRNFRYLPGADLAQEAGRLLTVEEPVAGLDRQEEAVAGREREPRHVEEGMIGHGQPVQREHPDHGGEAAHEDRPRERERDEQTPA